VKADVRQEPIYDNSGQALTSKALPALVSGDRISTQSVNIAAGSFKLNGISLGALRSQDSSGNAIPLDAKDVAAWLNTANADGTLPKPSGVTATASNEIRVADGRLNLTAQLSINGVDIGTAPFSNKQSLINAINVAGAGVQASMGGDGALVIANADGSNIDIATTASGVNTLGNALSLTAGLYGGTITMTRPLAAASVTLSNSNQIKIPASQLTADNLNLPLAINGQTIFKPSTGFGTVENLAAAINKAQTVVVAAVGEDGSLTLTSVNGPDSNSIQIATDSGGVNATGNALGIPAQVFRSAITDNSSAPTPTADTPIELGFGTATPADLAKLGFRTGAYIKGAAKEDLLVFVTGAGTASVAASYAGKPADARQSLRAQPMELSFTSATHYRIRDVNTDTIVAERDFNPDQIDLSISFQGLKVSFTTPPQAGDVFKVDGNSDGTGNNENMLAMAAVENKALVGNKTLGTAYIDHVNNIGNIARQATIAQAALKVVHDQAVTAKDQVSGVSLDQEAADLIRYQQAYQAAAKILQVGSQLFDSILQVR
jgi:hypothetical protein